MLCLLFPGLTSKNVKELGYSEEVVMRLMSRLKLNPINHACIEYHGWRNRKGYGRMKAKGRSMYTHRLAYELFSGEKLGNDDVVMHRCDNPRCCNPMHLVKGTILENNADRLAKGHYHINGRTYRRSTVEEILKIKLALKLGTMSKTEICNVFNLHWQTLKDIENGKTWKRVQLPEKMQFEYDPFLDF